MDSTVNDTRVFFVLLSFKKHSFLVQGYRHIHIIKEFYMMFELVLYCFFNKGCSVVYLLHGMLFIIASLQEMFYKKRRGESRQVVVHNIYLDGEWMLFIIASLQEIFYKKRARGIARQDSCRTQYIWREFWSLVKCGMGICYDKSFSCHGILFLG